MKLPGARDLLVGRAILGSFLVVLACDPPTAPPLPFYLDDFDSECGGVPCGWEQVGGSPGDVVFEPSIHASVAGITLRGSGTTVRGPMGDVHPVVFTMGTIELQMAARCDVGNSLLVQLVVEASAGSDGGVATVDVVEGRVTPAPDWTEPEAGNPSVATARTALVPGSPFNTGAVFDGRVLAITISKTGSGECTIDRVVVDEVGETQNRPASSCESDEE